MTAIARTPGSRSRVQVFATMALAAGTLGMAISFAFLASSHHLDVIAGAAGFVAGAILTASGLLSFAIVARASAADLTLLDRSPPAEAAPSVSLPRWLIHFTRNRENRVEPDWHAPITLPAEVIQPLVRSLEQFQLGDGGGPAYLIAHDRERILASGAGTRRLVDLWFAEESEHSRLLSAAVARFGGRCITSHWSFTAFCMTRRWFGARFELTVLLLTEIVSTVYYRLLWRHTNDPAVRAMCRLILRDEAGHIAFHRDRLATAARAGHTTHGRLWAWRLRTLGLAAATMLWVNHAPGLCAVGASTQEFYREVLKELSRFLRRLRQESLQH